MYDTCLSCNATERECKREFFIDKSKCVHKAEEYFADFLPRAAAATEWNTDAASQGQKRLRPRWQG
jgi:hypothetical protein